MQCRHTHLVELSDQQETGRNFLERFVPTCFRTTIRRVSALTAISSWHSLDYDTVCLHLRALAKGAHLYMQAPLGYDND